MTDIVNPIATRTYDKADGTAVEVILGAPQRDGDNWFTTWAITGLEQEPVTLAVGGVDAIQSLILALASLGDALAASGESLSFLGSEHLHLLHTEAHGGDFWAARVEMPLT